MTPEEELALKALEAAEWSARDGSADSWCPVCCWWKSEGHGADCPLKQALDALRAKRGAGSSSVAVEGRPYDVVDFVKDMDEEMLRRRL